MEFYPKSDSQDARSMVTGGTDLLWLLDADEIDLSKLAADCFVIYQGHHGDQSAKRADIILPGAAYTEKSGTYVNTEGRIQQGNRAILPPGNAKEDWKIISEIAQSMNIDLPYSNLYELRTCLAQAYPVFKEKGVVRNQMCSSINISEKNFEKQSFRAIISDYFLTNSISRASLTMHECSKTRGANSSVKAAE